MIKNKHLWVIYSYIYYNKNTYKRSSASKYYMCINCKLIEMTCNITEYLPDCLSKEELIIKNIIE